MPIEMYLEHLTFAIDSTRQRVYQEELLLVVVPVFNYFKKLLASVLLATTLFIILVADEIFPYSIFLFKISVIVRGLIRMEDYSYRVFVP